MNLGVLRDMALRGVTIAVRAGFTFYLAKVLSLEDFGTYAYIAATAAFLTYIGGADFYAYAHREFLSERCSLAPTIRAQVMVLMPSLTVAVLMGGWIAAGTLRTDLLWWMLGIVVGETLSAELVRLLIVCHRPGSANAVLFMKSAAWMVPWALFVQFEPLAKLETVCFAWTVGLVGAVAWGGWRLPVFFREIVEAKVPAGYFSEAVRILPRILIGTLALRGLFSLDRTALDYVFGSSMTGIYGFFVAIATAYLALLDAGILARLSPKLIAAAAKRQTDEITRLVREMRRWAWCMGGVALLVYAALIDRIIAVVGKAVFLEYRSIGFVLLVAYTVSASTTGVANVLYGQKKDVLVSIIHVIGLGPLLLGIWLASHWRDPLWAAVGVLAGLTLHLFFKSMAVARLRGHP